MEFSSTSGVVTWLRERSLDSPKKPSVARITELEELERNVLTPKVERQWWIHHFGLNRERLRGCMLSFSPDADTVFYFLYGIGSPYGAVFLRSVRSTFGRSRGEVVPDQDVLSFGGWSVYETYPFDPVNGVDIPASDDVDIYITDGCFIEHGRVWTNGTPVLFEQFARHWLRPGSSKQSASRSSASKVNSAKAALFEKYPWLSEADFKEPVTKKRKVVENSVDDEKLKFVIDDPPVDDLFGDDEVDKEESSDDSDHELHVDVDVVYVDELADLRNQLLVLDPVEDHSDFYTMVLGGRWTKKNIGVAGDRVGGFVRKGGVAQNWCDLSEVKN